MLPEKQASLELAEKREKELHRRFAAAISGGVVPTTAGTVIGKDEATEKKEVKKW